MRRRRPRRRNDPRQRTTRACLTESAGPCLRSTEWVLLSMQRFEGCSRRMSRCGMGPTARDVLFALPVIFLRLRLLSPPGFQLMLGSSDPTCLSIPVLANLALKCKIISNSR